MNGTKSFSESPVVGVSAAEKRVILSMGGKGGVGKTCLMTGLAEWFQENSIAVKLLDLDTENKSRGSLTHFFGGQVSPRLLTTLPLSMWIASILREQSLFWYVRSGLCNAL
jgi:Mrp family chromosome partitioning ATPase